MQKSKIVLITWPYDQGDILEDFLEWHLDLGVDLILAEDGGTSDDGSRAVLERYARTGKVAWHRMPERDMTKYSQADELAALARDEYGADWIVHCDVDEFLCTRGPDLRTLLVQADRDGVTLLDLPRRNMTGLPLPPGQRATQALTLRIDRQQPLTPEQIEAGDMPYPFIYLPMNGHLAVRTDALKEYGAGAHVATVTRGESRVSDQLYIVQFPCRGYEMLEQKVENIKAWFAANPHLPPGWGWSWRRLIRLQAEGRLREEYDSQFVSPRRAEELLGDGTCVVDETIARWLAQKEGRPFEPSLSAPRERPEPSPSAPHEQVEAVRSAPHTQAEPPIAPRGLAGAVQRLTTAVRRPFQRAGLP